MEEVALGLACLVGGLSLVALVVGITALGRTGDLARMRKRVNALEAEMARMRGLVGNAAAARAPGPIPASTIPEAAKPSVSPRVDAWAGERAGASVPPPVAAASAASASTAAPSTAAPFAAAGARPTPPRPPLPPRPPSPPRPPRAPAVPINWEKFLGVGAAAVFGGIVLAMAAFFLVKISIDRGWISPALRIVVALLAGIAAIGFSEALRKAKQDYLATANALAGAGIVILYAAFWSAHAKYHLIDVGPSFGAMVLVTVVAALLSLRYDSRVVAILGLVGGFLTPLLINTGRDNPIGLFGYIFLLDVGLLAVAHRKKWASLQILALVGTVFLEGLWIFGRMGPGTMLIGLGAVWLFGAVFAVSGVLAPKENRAAWLAGQAFGLLVPFLFAFYFAANTNLGDDPIPTVVLLVMLTALATFLGSREEYDLLGLGAAAGNTGVMLAFLLGREFDLATTWELIGVTVLLAVVPHIAAERRREVALPRGSGASALVAAGGLLLVVILASLKEYSEPVGPWLVAEVALGALLLRQSAFAGRRWLQLAPAILVPIGLCAYHDIHLDGRFPEPIVWLAILGIVAVLFQINAVVRRDAPGREAGEHAAATAALVLLAGFTMSSLYVDTAPALPALGLALALGFFVALAATRVKSGTWYLAAVGVTAISHVGWSFNGLSHGITPPLGPLAMLGAGAVFFTAWPFLAGETFIEKRSAWRAAALASPLWFLGLKQLWVAAFGDGFIAILPITLAAISLVAAARARVLWPDDDPIRKSALAWFAAIALGFISVTFPLQLDHQWITLGWALEGAAVLALWTRLDHRGLKYFGLALLAAVTVRLVFNPAVLEYEPRGGMRIVNWLLYSYAIPAAALLVAARLLATREVERARTWETPLYSSKLPLASHLCSLAAIAVVFVLINLEVVDWFASSDRLTLHFERLQSRDLAFSISWLVYALALLAIGIWRESKGPRWISLGLLLVSIFKVALYDMGALHDFKLVLSLAGLGATLILVSLVYQRFLFRSPAAEPEAT